MKTAKRKNKTIGLALGSGGSKGIAHIGVIKVLEENGIKIDYLAGCSIGAFFGVLYAASGNIKELEEHLFKSSSWRTKFSLLDPILGNGFLKGENVEKFIADSLAGINFSSLQIPFAAVAADLLSGREVIIKEGNVVKAVRASISIPPIFKPVELNGKLLVDGGLINPVPDDVVRKMGADIVIAVNLDNLQLNHGLSKNNLGINRILFRSFNIMRCYLADYCLKDTDVVISPKLTGDFGLLGWNNFFDRNKFKDLIMAGERAAKKALPELKKILKP